MFYTQSGVRILYLVRILYPVRSPWSAVRSPCFILTGLKASGRWKSKKLIIFENIKSNELSHRKIVAKGLCCDKVWGISMFSSCTPIRGIYRKSLLSVCGIRGSRFWAYVVLGRSFNLLIVFWSRLINGLVWSWVGILENALFTFYFFLEKSVNLRHCKGNVDANARLLLEAWNMYKSVHRCVNWNK